MEAHAHVTKLIFQVWPYLLGHYEWDSDEISRAALDESVRHSYETTMSEWLAVEAIVRQRDKETLQVGMPALFESLLLPLSLS